jgi:hypothetical protein
VVHGAGATNPATTMVLKAFTVWLLIFAVEVAHGALRTLYLVPLFGDLRSRQIGVAVGSGLILLVTWLTVKWIAPRTPRQRRGVGFLWVTLMIGAEVATGRYAFGYPWARITEDFDPTRGGFLALGMLVLYLAPGWMARLRGL